MSFSTKKHEPLKQRYNIVFLAMLSSIFITIYIGQNFFSYFTHYIFLVVILDQIARLFTSISVCEKRLLKEHMITYEQLRDYYQSKRLFRIIGAGGAGALGGVFLLVGYPFETVFPFGYAAVWLFYPLARKFFFKIPAPRIFKLIQEEFQKRESTPHHTFGDRSYDPLKLGTLGWQVNKAQELISFHSHRTTDSR